MRAIKAMGSGMVSRYGQRPARESWQPAFSIRANAGGMEPGGFRWGLDEGEGMIYRNGSGKKAALRDAIHPAPTIMFGARSNKVDWVDDNGSVVRVNPEQAQALQTYPPFKIERSTMTDHSNHKVLDLFAGSGVGVAIQNLGAEEFGVENMKEAIATRTANGMKTVYENVWDAHKAEMIIRAWRAAGIKWTLWASPPCQTFSLAGNGAGRKALDDVLGIIARKQYINMAELREQAALLGDERIGLVLSPLHYAVRFRPTYIAFEQVPPVLPVWEAMAVELREAGYSVWTGYLHAEQYGVPQTRKRAILMARNDGGVAKPPTPTHSKYYNRTPEKLDAGVEKWVSMEEALGWLVDRPSPTVTGGGTATGGAEPFGMAARDAIRRARREK